MCNGCPGQEGGPHIQSSQGTVFFRLWGIVDLARCGVIGDKRTAEMYSSSPYGLQEVIKEFLFKNPHEDKTLTYTCLRPLASLFSSQMWTCHGFFYHGHTLAFSILLPLSLVLIVGVWDGRGRDVQVGIGFRGFGKCAWPWKWDLKDMPFRVIRKVKRNNKCVKWWGEVTSNNDIAWFLFEQTPVPGLGSTACVQGNCECQDAGPWGGQGKDQHMEEAWCLCGSGWVGLSWSRGLEVLSAALRFLSLTPLSLSHMRLRKAKGWILGKMKTFCVCEWLSWIFVQSSWSCGALYILLAQSWRTASTRSSPMFFFSIHL